MSIPLHNYTRPYSVERFFTFLDRILSPLPITIASLASYLHLSQPISLSSLPSLSQFKESKGGLNKWLWRIFIFVWLKEANRALSRLVSNNGRWERDRPIWEREVVIITGGVGGIGGEIVEMLMRAKPGVKVAVLDVIEPPTLSKNPNLKYFRCNIIDNSQVEAVAREVSVNFGRPTILINAAGIMRSKTLLDMTSKEFDTMQKVNVLGSYNIIKSFLPSLIAQNHGHVIQISSTAGFITAPSMVDYACSKAAAIALHEGVGVELKWRYGAPNVKTSVICPIKVNTKLGSIVNDHKSKLMTPTQEPWMVAERVINVLDSGLSGGTVFIPSYLYVALPLIRVLPPWFGWYVYKSGDVENFSTSESWKKGIDGGYRILVDEGIV